MPWLYSVYNTMLDILPLFGPAAFPPTAAKDAQIRSDYNQSATRMRRRSLAGAHAWCSCRLIAAWSSMIERKTPRWRRRLVSLAKKPSTPVFRGVAQPDLGRQASVGCRRLSQHVG